MFHLILHLLQYFVVVWQDCAFMQACLSLGCLSMLSIPNSHVLVHFKMSKYLTEPNLDLISAAMTLSTCFRFSESCFSTILIDWSNLPIVSLDLPRST